MIGQYTICHFHDFTLSLPSMDAVKRKYRTYNLNYIIYKLDSHQIINEIYFYIFCYSFFFLTSSFMINKVGFNACYVSNTVGTIYLPTSYFLHICKVFTTRLWNYLYIFTVLEKQQFILKIYSTPMEIFSEPIFTWFIHILPWILF